MKNTFLIFYFKKIICLGLIFFTVEAYGQVTPLGFETVFYEGFNYPAGQDLYYQSGGTGFTSNWGGYYQSKYLSVQSTGWSYPNLQTTGRRAGYDSTCYGACNDISSSGRAIPSQSSGVLYVQFLANFGTQAGGGTPHFRLYNGSNLKVALGSMTTSSWQMLDVDSNTTVSTSSSLSGLKLVVIRFDYDNNNMKLWINPNLATFDYSNAPTPSTEINNITVSSFNRLELYFRSNGSPGVDEIHAFKSLPPTTAPTTISGTATICAGDSTSLTASGGTTNSDAVAVWYEGVCGDQGFHEGWETQPYGAVATTVNANANGVLNVTSTSGDPYINMFNLGSFDPTLYKYINFRYKVNSGTATAAQIFFLNGAMTLADGAKYKNTPLISDGQWHTAVVDMSTHPLWASDGNITGIRYDYTTASGVTMDLDFIELSSAPIVGTGNTITVSPTANTSYYVNRKGPETNTSCISQLVTVNQIPVITNFNYYSKTYFDESFTIANPTSASAGLFSYTSDNASVATISGNTVTITGVGTANITATQAANGSFCSNTATVPLTVNGVSVVTKNGEISATNSNYVNKYGKIGDITGISKNGLLLDTKSPFSGGTFDGYTYNVVTTATGRVWLDRNLGATQVASSSTDAASFGDLYQWGRGTDGHEKRTSTNISTVSTTDTPGHGFFINGNSFNWQSPVNTELWQGVDGKNNPCPKGFRLPTIEEFEAEVVLWNSQNAAGALASSLKLPIAGRRHTNGSIYSVGSNGMYRTNSTLILNITSTSAARAGDQRIDGFCVRCIKD